MSNEFESCTNCIHAHDAEPLCILRLCKHAIAETKECYVPSAQPETTRTFVELVVEYPDPELCTYKEYKGKPYYSIKYIENGETHIGYGTYKPEVLSQFLKEYFISSAQPEPSYEEIKEYCRKRCLSIVDTALLEKYLPSAQPEQRWISCKERMPYIDGEYLITKKCFGWNCKKYYKPDIAWYGKKSGWDKADEVIAWCELPEPWKEGDSE